MKKQKENKKLFILFRLFLFLSFACYCVTYHYNLVYILGDSMSSTYLDRDISIISYKYYNYHEIKVGDIVCARILELTENDGAEEILVIKRVLGKHGDQICILNGKLYINGEENIDYGIGNAAYTYFYKVLNEKEYFLMGDNRDVSRLYIVDKYQITGKVIL